MGAPEEKTHPLIDAINKVSQIKGLTVGKDKFKLDIGQHSTKIPSGFDRRSWSPTYQTEQSVGFKITKDF